MLQTRRQKRHHYAYCCKAVKLCCFSSFWIFFHGALDGDPFVSIFQVGGGLSAGFGVVETAVKEAEEEANVPEGIARRMVPAGTVS